MKRSSVCRLILMMVALATFGIPVFASDSSDAETLRQKCEKEILKLEVCVANFGDTGDKASFAEASKNIKLAKVRITQSKFKDAIDKYNGYLKIQSETYKSLAEKYLSRTQKMNDEIAEELADSIDKPKVDDYFKLAYRNLEDGKTAMIRTYSLQAIEACRRSKQYSLGVYGLLSKPVPAKYKTDLLDNEGKIAAPIK